VRIPAFVHVDVTKYRLQAGDPLRVKLLLALAPFVVLSLADGWYKEPLFAWSPIAFWIADATKFVLVPALALAWLRLGAGVRPAHYGMARPDNLDRADFLKLLVLVCAVMAYLLDSSTRLGAALFPDRPSFTYLGAMPQGMPRPMLALYFSLTAALVEEVMFRGLPWLWLSGYMEGNRLRWTYLLWSSITFAGTHWENGQGQLFATFIYGLAAGGWFLVLRSLWPLVLAHLAIDLYIFF
jgi:hypothetical protein